MMGVNSPGFELGLFVNGLTGVVVVVVAVAVAVVDVLGEIECDESM